MGIRLRYKLISSHFEDYDDDDDYYDDDDYDDDDDHDDDDDYKDSNNNSSCRECFPGIRSGTGITLVVVGDQEMQPAPCFGAHGWMVHTAK